MASDVQNFQEEVVKASYSTPVVIDFWAPWCGPCRVLGPVIEKLADEAEGRWKLAKVNTDRNPDAAIEYGVRGIPSVKMMHEGEIIAEFTGAQPEARIRKWLDENLPQNGSSIGDWSGPIKEALGSGDFEEARSVMDEVYDSEKAGDEMNITRALLNLPDRLEEAREAADRVNDEIKYDMELMAVNTVGHLKEVKDDERLINELEGQAGGAEFLQATKALFNKNFENALEQYLESMQINRQLDDDGARKACLAIFSMLSEQHPLTKKYRRRFSMVLY